MPLDEEQAIAFLRRWFDEIWHKGNLDVLDELVHDPYIRHTSQGKETISVAEYRKRVVQSQRVLHGAATTIDDHVVSGDRIWARATSRGVNLETVGPNTITWMTCYRIVDGKVAEAWIATLPGVDWET
jgi:predicted SnoaL-like aldol condensation-catalyzing enzyme